MVTHKRKKDANGSLGVKFNEHAYTEKKIQMTNMGNEFISRAQANAITSHASHQHTSIYLFQLTN